VRLVGETGEALARIQAGVMEINTSVSEIASSAKEQATGLAEVNTAINQMDQVTQQNAAMVEQSTAAAHSLSHETDEMNQAVGRFRVKHDPTADDALRSRKRVGESR
jgi:methyl-accepting chemotaxis protein